MRAPKKSRGNPTRRYNNVDLRSGAIAPSFGADTVLVRKSALIVPYWTRTLFFDLIWITWYRPGPKIEREPHACSTDRDHGWQPASRATPCGCAKSAGKWICRATIARAAAAGGDNTTDHDRSAAPADDNFRNAAKGGSDREQVSVAAERFRGPSVALLRACVLSGTVTSATANLAKRQFECFVARAELPLCKANENFSRRAVVIFAADDAIEHSPPIDALAAIVVTPMIATSKCVIIEYRPSVAVEVSAAGIRNTIPSFEAPLPAPIQ